MASRNKRPQIEAEGPDTKRTKNHDGDGVGNEVVAPAAFTDDLLNTVFNHLPVLSALKMALVSPRFENLWKTSRNMIFDRSAVGGFETMKVITIVHFAMNWHEGERIDKFSICMCPDGLNVLLNHWLDIATEKRVREVELDYSPSQVPCPLNADLSGASTLTTLKLVIVKLEMPRLAQEWAGMVNLRDLRLRNCDLEFIKDVFILCQGLECLEIVDCKNVGKLFLFAGRHRNLRTLKIGGCLDLKEIHLYAPTLKSFYYQGNIRMITIHGSMPHLNQVFISYIPSMWIVPENLCMEILASSAASLKIATLNNVFVEVICAVLRRGLHGATLMHFSNLTELQILMEMYTYQTIGDVFYFLKRCPRLETLHIDLGRCHQEEAAGGFFRMLSKNTVQSASPQPFHYLTTLKIKGFKTSQNDRDLLEYLVTKSPSLQTIALVTSETSNFNTPSLQSQYVRHLRNISISTCLKISIHKLNDDHSCIFPMHSKTWYSA